jgi:streptogramin lyase
MPPNSSVPSPSSYSPLSIQGHSLQTGVLTVNEGQWSNLSELLRSNTQAKLLNNFQMLTRGIWTNPTGIGWTLQRAGVFNGGAAFMDFGVLVDFQGNRTLLFQVGNTLYSYDLATSTETAYTGALSNLSTSLINLPTIRGFVDSTNSIAPYTIYTNGDIQPQKIVTTADKNGISAEYVIPTATSAPAGICVGPDGNIWAVENSGNKILQIIPFTGVIKEFTIPTATSAPRSICTGPDGNLWFTEQTGNKIGKMTTLGAFTEYVLPTPSSQPYGICLGPDNLLWFTEFNNDKVASITTNGLITEYTIPTTTSKPTGICAGPDGLVWFCESNTNKIAKVTVSTSTDPLPGTITEYVIPTSTSGPQSICAGPVSDGRLWFTEFSTSKIGAVTTAGVFTEYTSGLTPSCEPYGICLGNDQNLWFTEYAGNNIGRITPAGIITEFAIPTPTSHPEGIVFGGNNQLWYTENATNKIGALQLANLPMEFIATVNTTSTTPTVDITEYLIPNASTTTTIAPYGITSAGDGNMYFLSYNNVGGATPLFRVTTAGTITATPCALGANFTLLIAATPPATGTASTTTQLLYLIDNVPQIYQVPVSALASPTTLVTFTAAQVNGICIGPDGNGWATLANSTIIQVTPAGAVTTFTIPTGGSNPWGICSGPDGRLWFTERTGNKIGAITTAGVFTEYTTGLTAACQPYDIIEGPDGNLWFTENTGNNIGRITTGGTITEFALPTASAGPAGLCQGQDGNIYFCENTASKIGIVGTDGVITEYATPTAASGPLKICLGPDNNLWFTENGASQIGKLVRTVAVQPTLTTQAGSWPGIFYLNGKTYSKPKYSTYFNNRQAYFGFDPSGLAAYDVLISAQGNAESFVNSTPINATDACSFTFADSGLGLPTGEIAFRLANTNNQEILLLGFQNGFVVIAGNGTSSDATTYEATILTKEYGLMSNRTFTQIMNDMYFLSTNGVRNYSNLSINANLLNANLTYQMQDVIEGITTAMIPSSNIYYNSQAFSVSNRPTLEVQYWYPSTTDGDGGVNFTNQHSIIMNYNSLTPTPQAINPIFSTKSGTEVACGIYFMGIFYGGGYDGHLQVHYSGNTYNGAAIPGTLGFSLINAGNVQQNLELRQAIVVTEGDVQDFNVIVYFYTKQADGTLLRAPSPEGSQELAAGVEGETILGSWILGTSSFPANHIKHLEFDATGEGPYAEIQLLTNGVDQALDFDAIAFTITVGGLRP